jgi:Gpi18-like mannosyltransferase
MNQKSFSNLLVVLMLAFGLFVRMAFLPVVTVDMNAYLLWYNFIAQHGILQALGDQVFGYNPPFIYLLSLATLSQAFLPKVWAIKLISILFDLVNTVLVYRIVKINFQGRSKPILAALLFWVTPTVMINSSIWGQTDAIYTCFLLLALLFFFEEHPNLAIIAFALSISIKAQGIFLAPLLVILLLRRRVRWYAFLLVPLVYVLTFLPTFLAGRPLGSLLTTYTAQGETFSRPSMNAPNLYFFLSQNTYQVSLSIGIPLAGLILLSWVLVYGLRHYEFTKSILMISALISVALVPFLLPKMHDRYFYPADVFSLLAAFIVPGLWFLPIAFQAISLLAYLPYLFGVPSERAIPLAVIINVVTIGFLLWKQWKMSSVRSIAQG